MPYHGNRSKFMIWSDLHLYAHYIGPNPSVPFNEKSAMPSVDPSSFVGPFSCVIGDVTIQKNVFIAPNVSIRADEGFPFLICQNTNLQDGVIVHGLLEGRVTEGGKEYSVYIGSNVTCAHGCIVHGPCKLENNVFIGFGAIIYNAIVGEGSYISINALVTGGVKIPPGRFVPPGTIVDSQARANALGPVPKSQKDFAQEVQHVNQTFPTAYLLMFGYARCSCGLACDPKTLLRN
jgi:carbonic anhydrase